MVVSLVVAGPACRYSPLDAKGTSETWSSLRSVANTLEGYRATHGRWPQQLPAMDLGATEGAAAPITRPRDAWGNELVFLVTDGGEHYLLLSAGSDGQMEGDFGGPTLGWERGHDLAVLDGTFFQYPEGYQDGYSRSQLRAMVARDRARAKARWASDEYAQLRTAHGVLVQSASRSAP